MIHLEIGPLGPLHPALWADIGTVVGLYLCKRVIPEFFFQLRIDFPDLIERQIFQGFRPVSNPGFLLLEVREKQLFVFNAQLPDKVPLFAKEQPEHIVIPVFPERLYVGLGLLLCHVQVPDIAGDPAQIQTVAVDLLKGVEGGGDSGLGVIAQDIQHLILVKQYRLLPRGSVKALPRSYSVQVRTTQQSVLFC